MHPFFYLIDKTACRSSHHRLALDALLHLRCRHAQRWQRLFLRYYRDFLDGALAPDHSFRDYENHVLHVEKQNWGGAPAAAAQWYEQTVEAIAQHAWRNAAYSAGVLSHYITDPLFPFQTQFENPGCDVQHAFQWSTAKAYRRIRPLWNVPLERIDVSLATHGPWLRKALIEGAEQANGYAVPLAKQYDFRSALTWPVSSLNESSRTALGKLIRSASGLFAAVLSRAIDEVDDLPPIVHLHGEAALAVVKSPVRIARRVGDDIRCRWEVWSMVDEWERLGSVQNRWPAEMRAIAEATRRSDYGKKPDYENEDELIQTTRRTDQAEANSDAEANSTANPTSSKKERAQRDSQINTDSKHRKRRVGLKRVAQRIAAGRSDRDVPASSPRKNRDATVERHTSETSASAAPHPAAQTHSPSHAPSQTQSQGQPLGQRERMSRQEVKPSRTTLETTRTSSVELSKLNLATRTTEKSQPTSSAVTQEKKSEIDRRQPSVSTERSTTKDVPTSKYPSFDSIAGRVDDARTERASIKQTQSSTAKSVGLGAGIPIEQTEAITEKNKRRLRRVGVTTIAELLQQSAAEIATLMGSGIDPQTIRDWQVQTRFLLELKSVKPYEAKLLSGVDCQSSEALAAADPFELFVLIEGYAKSAAGQRSLAGARRPDLDRVEEWITEAQFLGAKSRAAA